MKEQRQGSINQCLCNKFLEEAKPDEAKDAAYQFAKLLKIMNIYHFLSYGSPATLPTSFSPAQCTSLVRSVDLSPATAIPPCGRGR